jgi:hypothetical protein
LLSRVAAAAVGVLVPQAAAVAPASFWGRSKVLEQFFTFGLVVDNLPRTCHHGDRNGHQSPGRRPPGHLRSQAQLSELNQHLPRLGNPQQTFLRYFHLTTGNPFYNIFKKKYKLYLKRRCRAEMTKAFP